MEINHAEVAPGKVAITLAGKLMVGGEGGRIVELVETLLRDGKRIFIFDLAGVTVIDSTGVGHFISSFNKIMGAGGEMRMAGATGHVFHTFHVSLLDQVFPFFPSVEEAAK
ncbi:putative Anti-sigma-B factor antagonist [Candidatus Sulfopaludibacter sp. SbA3]|nr:putative Anti-sigma-B factor antagonist [Candidatus Sulfopaludibacter sp. SbA3]